MKKVVFIILLAAILAFSGVLAFAEGSVKVKLNGSIIEFSDAKPYIDDNNRTLVPVRFVSEALSAQVDWQASTQLVTIRRGNTRIALKIGDSFAIVNNSTSDSKVSFDTEAILKDSRTFVPLRFVSEALNCIVNWDAATKTVNISSGTSQNESQSIYEDFKLVEGGAPPAGFIVPQFRIVHNTSSNQTVYFYIEFTNLMDYKDVSSDYTFKIECANYPELNTSQMIRPDGTAGHIVNEARTLKLSDMFDPYSKAPFYIRALPYYYYTTFEIAKNFSLAPGMNVTYRITFTKGKYYQVYEATATLRDKLR